MRKRQRETNRQTDRQSGIYLERQTDGEKEKGKMFQPSDKHTFKNTYKQLDEILLFTG